MARWLMGEKVVIHAGRRELHVSSLDKVLFPVTGFTKGDVLNYYVKISEHLLPHLRERPLTLKLYLNGIHAPAQYVKNAPVHRPQWIRTASVWRRSGESKIHYVLVNDLPALIWVVNHYNLEMHIFLAQAADVDRPTMVVFDLDPGEPATVLDCAQVALFLCERLKALNLRCFVKASGSRGLHLVIPLNTRTSYEQTQRFAIQAAMMAHEQFPELVTTEMAKEARRGKVFIDYSQNVDFKSTASVYSLRAKPNGPFISIPLKWSEVAAYLKHRNPNDFLVRPDAALERVQRFGDLFAPVLKLKQALPETTNLQEGKRASSKRKRRKAESAVRVPRRPELQPV